MRRRILLLLAALTLALAAMAQGRAKYVFYFIGDGMGVNQVNGAETYRAALAGQIGIAPLCFTEWPAAGLVTTYSATNGVTDSAAAGTALATGHKTRNGVLGMLADGQTPVESVATWAQDAGAAVGIGTTVSVDHATPAAFYAHVADRGLYYEVGRQLIAAGFDFYAGSDFKRPLGADSATAGSLYEQCERAGYVVARGLDELRARSASPERVVLLQSAEASRRDRTALPYAIDRQPSDLTLAQITQAAIAQLTRTGKDGFFLMLEGGKVDWACHSNDAATAFREVEDMDAAVRVAYDFYLAHPDETLIVVTADHETGGLALGRGPYELRTHLLAAQRMSVDRYTLHLDSLRRADAAGFTWERVRSDLATNWGFWGAVTLTEGQTARLERAWQAVATGTGGEGSGHYVKLDRLADEACAVMAEAALLGWQCGEHSNGYVPVFATGVGAEQFTGRLDNTQIPLRIAKAAGWKVVE